MNMDKSMESETHHHKGHKTGPSPQNPFMLPLGSQPLPHSQPLATTGESAIPALFHFPEEHMNEVIHYVSFWMWLLSLDIMYLRSVNTVWTSVDRLSSLLSHHRTTIRDMSIYSPAPSSLACCRGKCILHLRETCWQVCHTGGHEGTDTKEKEILFSLREVIIPRAG